MSHLILTDDFDDLLSRKSEVRAHTIHSGYLLERSGRFGLPRRKYVVLRDGYLAYYKNKESSNQDSSFSCPMGKVNLSGATVEILENPKRMRVTRKDQSTTLFVNPVVKRTGTILETWCKKVQHEIEMQIFKYDSISERLSVRPCENQSAMENLALKWSFTKFYRKLGHVYEHERIFSYDVSSDSISWTNMVSLFPKEMRIEEISTVIYLPDVHDFFKQKYPNAEKSVRICPFFTISLSLFHPRNSSSLSFSLFPCLSSSFPFFLE